MIARKAYRVMWEEEQERRRRAEEERKRKEEEERLRKEEEERKRREEEEVCPAAWNSSALAYLLPLATALFEPLPVCVCAH